MPISSDIQAAVRSSGAFPPGARILAMLSGGADSVCLVHVLRESLGPESLFALHVNHGLRTSADVDERFCAELCERLGVPLVNERVAVDSRGNLEGAAREARYAAAERVRAQHDLDAIATGHTATDQVETVLYRLVVSPGRRALLAILPRSGRVVRPLLAITRAQARDYCREQGLDWREDETNLDRRLARNRLRLDVLPVLRELHPAIEENVRATVSQLREEAEVLDAAVEEAIERVASPAPLVAVDAGRLAELPPALRRLVLRRLAEQAAGATLALSQDRVHEIERLATRGGSGALDIGAGVRVVAEYGVLRFLSEAAEREPEPAVLTVPGRCRFGDWALSCELERDGTSRDRDLGSVDEPLVDAARLGPELTVRSWREGDRMQPLGLRGSKSLQDLFTDHKVPRSLRHRLPVVVCDGEIAWVAGVALSDRFKLTAGSERAARLRASAVAVAKDG
jgi:tRNA(Ile)-lysidine synthase